MARNYAALLYEYLEEMADLTDAEFGRLARALLVYSSTGEFPALSGNERFFRRRIMLQEDRAKESYDATVRRNRQNGQSGGRPKKESITPQDGPDKAAATQGNPGEPTKSDPNPVGPKQTQKTESKTEPEPESKSKSPKGGDSGCFTPPTREEVAAYCRERGNGVDPGRFIDFYTANGWVQGRGKPIKDWKAAVRTWEKGSNGTSMREKATGEKEAFARAKANMEWFKKHEAAYFGLEETGGTK